MYDYRTNWETKITFDVMHEDGEIAETYTEQTMREACIMFDALDSDYDPNGYTVETYRYLEDGSKHLELRKYVKRQNFAVMEVTEILGEKVNKDLEIIEADCEYNAIAIYKKSRPWIDKYHCEVRAHVC